jgi:hypothetical protein
MQASPERRSVDLGAYPDLIVIILGFRIRRLRGILSMFGVGRGLSAIRRDPPEGLLADEQFLFSLTHIGIRQYWRDLESLERFTRGEPHARWWREFMKDMGGTGFWHESYSARGGMEAIYIDMPQPVGFARFAPPLAPVGPFLSARARLTRRAAPAASM